MCSHFSVFYYFHDVLVGSVVFSVFSMFSFLKVIEAYCEILPFSPKIFWQIFRVLTKNILADFSFFDRKYFGRFSFLTKNILADFSCISIFHVECSVIVFREFILLSRDLSEIVPTV